MKIITTNRFRALCHLVGGFALGLAWVSLIAGILAGVLLTLVEGPFNVYLKDSDSHVAMGHVSLSLRIALILCLNGYTVSFFLFCVTLCRLLRCYSRGLYFAQDITHAYYRLAAFAFALWLVQIPGLIVARCLPVTPAGSAWKDIFDFDFSSLVLTLILLILAWVMGEGARVQEEQSLTV